MSNGKQTRASAKEKTRFYLLITMSYSIFVRLFRGFLKVCYYLKSKGNDDQQQNNAATGVG